MNEQLQKALTDLIQSTLDAKTFIMAELPDVIHQLLLWEIAKNSIFLTLLTIIPMCLVITLTKLVKLAKVKNEYADAAGDFGDLSAVVMVFVIPYWVISLYCLLKVLIAPKIFLIEYAANLVK